VNDRMVGRNGEVSVAADASHSLSFGDMVFIKKIAYESVEGHKSQI
jgi:hypothetical protein